MKSAYSAIHDFDWVLISFVVCIIQIVTLCTLRVGNPNNILKLNYSSFLSFNKAPAV
jgi:hypothetical protein